MEKTGRSCRLAAMAICAGLLCGTSATLSAAAIDFTTGITAGTLIVLRNDTFSNGAPIDFPIADYLANKTYSAQIVPTGSTTDKSEAYNQVGPNKEGGFASALADGRGALEVGVDSKIFSGSTFVSVSRYYTTIKNNTEDEIGFDFYYVIPGGSVEILGTRFDFPAARARVQAQIDYRLRTPEGGVYVDTTGELFRYEVELTNEGRRGTLDHTSNASLVDLSDSRRLFYGIEKYSGVADLPMIPAYGELTVYYDMYALFSSVGLENLGSAYIGDPTQLVQREGAQFVQSDVEAVPEPATYLLTGIAFLALPFFARQRRLV